MGAQRFELPIGIGDHMDAAVAIHQYREIAIVRTRGAGRGEDLFGMSEERAHKALIAPAGFLLERFIYHSKPGGGR